MEMLAAAIGGDGTLVHWSVVQVAISSSINGCCLIFGGGTLSAATFMSTSLSLCTSHAVPAALAWLSLTGDEVPPRVPRVQV